MPKKTKSKVQSSKPELVIMFVGKRKKLDKITGKIKTVPAEAPAKIINGQKVIELPAAEIQVKGFTHQDAAFLISVYPKQFKRKLSKGK